MRRLVVIFTFALLLFSTGKSDAGCYVRYWHRCPRVVVYHRPCPRAWVPGYWRWDWSCRRYFWVRGYWY